MVALSVEPTRDSYFPAFGRRCRLFSAGAEAELETPGPVSGRTEMRSRGSPLKICSSAGFENRFDLMGSRLRAADCVRQCGQPAADEGSSAVRRWQCARLWERRGPADPPVADRVRCFRSAALNGTVVSDFGSAPALLLQPEAFPHRGDPPDASVLVSLLALGPSPEFCLACCQRSTRQGGSCVPF